MGVNEPPINEVAFFFCPRLSKVKQHVEQNFSGPITLAQAAHVAGLEKTYFSKYFHERTGVCFKDWIGLMRIKRAIAMLMNHDYNITELAFAVGFQDLRTFERAFKKFVGVTPRECKRIALRHMAAGLSSTPLLWEEIAPTEHDVKL